MQGLSSKSDSKFDLASALPVLVHDMGTQQVGSQTLYSVSKQALFTDAIDEVRDYRCFETPQGWVLALDRASLQTFLWCPQDSSKRISCHRCRWTSPIDASVCYLTCQVFDLDDTDVGLPDWSRRMGLLQLHTHHV